ncbi:hypothetical protein TNCV_4026911 [Trichonephila clavipes]|nr:hypothetical protein TNCV_4026911 [Trichonephila clavipes]
MLRLGKRMPLPGHSCIECIRTPKRGNTSLLTGAGSLLPPLYSEAWAKENAEVSSGHHFPLYGTQAHPGAAETSRKEGWFRITNSVATNPRVA